MGIVTKSMKLLLALLLGARMLLGTKGIATRNKKLLGAPVLTTRSKDATRNKGRRYQEQETTRGSCPYY